MTDSAPTAAIQIPLLPMRRRRARLVAALLSHGPAAVLLLSTGSAALRSTPFPHGAALALAVFATVAGALQAYVLVQEVRESRHLDARARAFRRDTGGGADEDSDTHAAHGHEAGGSGFHVPSLVLSLVYAAETWVHWSESGHITRPYVFGAVAFGLLGVGGMRWLMQRKANRSSLVVDATGIRLTRPRHRVEQLRFAEIAGITFAGTMVRVDGAAEHTGFALDTAAFDHGRDIVSRLRDAVTTFGHARLLAAGAPADSETVDAGAPPLPS